MQTNLIKFDDFYAFIKQDLVEEPPMDAMEG